MLKTGDYSDFVLIAGSEMFRVHKNILSARSSVFNEIFKSNQEKLKVESLAAESVEQFVEFIYTGTCSMNKNAKEVFALASKFQIIELKLKCEKRILKDLDQSEAFKVFQLRHRYSSDKLKCEAFKKIKKMFPGTVLPDSYINMPDKVAKLEEKIKQIEAKKKEVEEIMRSVTNLDLI
jgi:speckle-type POZ protein